MSPMEPSSLSRTEPEETIEMSESTPLTEDPRPRELTTPDSLVVLHTGNGKGKTTAAIGTAVRARALGWPVVVLQFIKSGEWKSGEEASCRTLGIEFQALGSGFTWDSADLDKDKAVAREAWSKAADIIRSGTHRMVVLDELTYLCSWGWIDTEEVVGVIRDRPADMSILITGRDADDRLVALADTASEVRSIHHAYDRGIAAMRGIDF